MTRNILSKSLALGALVGALTLLPAVKSEAAFVAWICNDVACSGGDDLSASDGGGGDANGLAGVINFSTTYMGYELVINTSQSKPFLSNGMDLNYTIGNQSGSDPATGTIYLFAVDTDFTNGPATAKGSLGGTNTSGGSTTTAYICDGDANVGNFSPCSSNSTTGALGFNMTVTHPVTANPYA